MGRVSPAAFDRAKGRLIHTPFFGKTIGGTYALLAEGQLVTGTEELIAYGADSPRSRFAWFWGRQIIVTKETSYLLSDDELSALNRKTYPAASLKRRSLLGRKQSTLRNLSRARLSLIFTALTESPRISATSATEYPSHT